MTNQPNSRFWEILIALPWFAVLGLTLWYLFTEDYIGLCIGNITILVLLKLERRGRKMLAQVQHLRFIDAQYNLSMMLLHATLDRNWETGDLVIRANIENMRTLEKLRVVYQRLGLRTTS